jgi:hypothetical protein
MRRKWRTHDLVDLFWAIERGHLPMNCITNSDMASWDDYYSVPIETWWPGGLPDTDNTIMEFKIEDNIEVPAAQGYCREVTQTMVQTMLLLEPGQSFFVPLRGKKDMVRNLQQFFSKAKHTVAMKNIKHTFVSRKMMLDEQETGIRIWRLE